MPDGRPPAQARGRRSRSAQPMPEPTFNPTPRPSGRTDAIDCFLLTRAWRDTSDGLELELWGASDRRPVRVIVTGEEAVCFVERSRALALERLRCRRRPLDLRALSGEPVDALYFRRQRDLAAARRALSAEGVRLLESDLKPSERYLMERFVSAAFRARGEISEREGYLELRNPLLERAEYRARLRAVALDIETDGLDGRLYSIAVAGAGEACVFLVNDGEPPAAGELELRCFGDERSLVEAFVDWVRRVDPDLVLGWNVVAFDLDFLERLCRRLGVPFALGRAGASAAVLAPEGTRGNHVARVPGRVVLDGIDALRAAFWSFESFALEAVAQTLLGRGKRIAGNGDRVQEIRRLYHEDPVQLAAYNLEDCRLVLDIFAETRLIDFLVRRAELTGLALDRFGGSVAAFDHLYLPRLHRRGRVAPSVERAEPGPASPGGYVLDSRPGLYDNVLALDFKSLYPSIIRTFRIDPLGLAEPGSDPVPGFLGARFAREGGILPELIEALWRVRDEARRAGDAALAQAVKILMNSFYGVLAADGCRFHDPRLASSITRRGHEIIKESRSRLEAEGYPVIYGDTDSLFVLLGPGIDEGGAIALGRRLAASVNALWRERLAGELGLESCLELELDAHYLKFLMPTVRGETTGSKKRYAGLVRGADGRLEVVFRGLESARSDWTPLARRFQRELYRRIFCGEPFEDYVRDILAQLMAGRLDRELVYRKRLRRRLDDYARGAPPHVRAARKLERPGRWVSYVMTSLGPEPVENGRLPRPDYGHYRDRQLAPAADGILGFLGTSFAALTDPQVALF